jgi:GAF domain-containing protein
MSDSIRNYLTNPLVLGIAAAALVIVLLLIIFLVMRSRRGGRAEEDKVRTELVALEKESQFAAAVEQIPFQASPEEIAEQLARVFKDHLAMPVFKIYAGRESDQEFSNILPKEKSGAFVTNALAITSALPPTIPANAALGFSRPQLINTNALMTQQPTTPGQSVTALPWRGAFGWYGLIIANALQTHPGEALSNFLAPIASLGNKLGVALEMSSEFTGSHDLERRVQRSDQFYQAIITSLGDESPLASIMHEIATLLGGDSSALWLLDNASQMLRLHASWGLRSTEFLPLPLGQGLAGSIMETGNPLALEDAPSDPRCIFPREARDSGVGSYLGVPLISDGVVLGALEVHTLDPKWWSDNDATTLITAASAVAAAMKYTAGRGSKLRVENAYLGLAEALQRLRTPEELKEAAVEVLGHALGVSRATILDFDRQTGPVAIQQEFKDQNTKSALGATFTGSSLQQIIETSSDGEPVAISDSRAHSLIEKDLVTELGILSELAIPVKFNDKTRALIYLHQCDRVRVWHPDEIEFADRVGRQLSLSLANVLALNAATQSAEAAREAARSASDSINRSQVIVNSLPEALLGLDREGHLTFFNNQARNWLQLKQEDLGKMANWIDRLGMADPMFWSRVTSSKTIARFESRLKYNPTIGQTLTEALIMNDDDSLPVQVSVAPMRGQTGEANGFLIVLSDVSKFTGGDSGITARISTLLEQQAELERNLSDMRTAELHARSRIEKLNSLEAHLREGPGKSNESEWQQERERFRQEVASLQNHIHQLMNAYQLKSEFIVTCGNQMETALQSAIGMGEMLEKGIYGQLTRQQQDTVGELLREARKIRSDIDSLVEYGSSRAR